MMRTPYYILLAGCLVCLVQALPQPQDEGEGEGEQADQEGSGEQPDEEGSGEDELVGGNADNV